MFHLRGQVLVQLLSLRGTDAAQGIVALEGFRQRGTHKILETSLDGCHDLLGSDVWLRAQKELAERGLIEAMLQDADAVLLRGGLELVQPGFRAGGLSPEGGEGP